MEDIARKSIEKNIVKHNGVQIITAGQSIYYGMWSRDFLYLAKTLMKSEEWRPAVKDTIDLILQFKNDQDLLPKGIDTMKSFGPWNEFEWRVVRGSIRSFFRWNPERIEHKGSWNALYKDNNNSEAIDTNLLLINALMDLYKYDKYKMYVRGLRSTIIKLYQFYDPLIKDEMIVQKSFSDWKDSVSRCGTTFLTNLLYWKVTSSMKKSGLFDNVMMTFGSKPFKLKDPDTIRMYLITLFYDTDKQVFMSTKTDSDNNYYGIDENLLAIYWDLLEGLDLNKILNDTSPKDIGLTGIQLYKTISNRQEWGFVGPVIVPSHPWHEKPTHIWIAGIQGYHDDSYWSWVIALAATVSYKLGFVHKGSSIKKMFEKMIIRDGTVYECFSKNSENELVQTKTRAFRSEHDWLWGAAYVLEMCSWSKEYKITTY